MSRFSRGLTSPRRLRRGGFSLIEVVVGVALVLILFLALFGVLRASLLVSSLARAKAGATTVAQAHMEYLRGLSYSALGTVGGIPAGAVAQDIVTNANGIPYALHTFISYVDDAADGIGAADENLITTDYKRARVTVSYVAIGQEKEVGIVSNFAPAGVETSSGGGTLEIHAVDATGAPVSAASVTIVNPLTVPAVNLATFTNSAGAVYLPGAATSTGYQISVAKNGYSSAQTYARDTTNQNPNPGYLTVVQNQTTVGTFAIDLLSTFDLSTRTESGTTTVPLPNVSFTLTGEKTVGSTGSGDPLYKTTVTDSTGASAAASLTLEWDTYALSVTGYDITDACPSPPFALAPGAAASASLTLGPATEHSLRTFVSDNAGAPVAGALVTLSRTGFSKTMTSSSCGSAYVGALTAAADYTLTLEKSGYTTTVLTGVSVSGPTALGASFP